MTDYDKVKSLFIELGIPFSETFDGNKMIHVEVDNKAEDSVVIGYQYFTTDFEFTEKDGKFVNIGIWEL